MNWRDFMENARILVVDDSEITLFKIKAILLRLGYVVTTHTNPLNALEWIKAPGSGVDLILSDMNMPEMSGVDFVKALRALPGTANTPVIMLTSLTEMDDKIAGLQAGADDYIGKTVTPTELDLRLKAMLARSQTTETTFTSAVARTISVFSLRGGVGTSTISVNLAIALSQLWGIDACLWDMAIPSGHCATMLNIKPKNTLASLGNDEGPIEEHTLAQLLVQHGSGIKVMPAPLDVADAELVTPKVVDQVWSYLQGNFSYLVVDAGHSITESVLNILERSDVILLTLAPEIASVKSAGDALNAFDQMGFDLNKVWLVVSNTFPKLTLPVRKILPVLRNRPAFEIPYDSDRIVEAILTGQPMITTAPKSDVGLAIIAIAYKLSVQQMESKKKASNTPMLDSIRKFFKEI